MSTTPTAIRRRKMAKLSRRYRKKAGAGAGKNPAAKPAKSKG